MTDERLAELEALANAAPEPDRELWLNDDADMALLDKADELYIEARTAVPELVAEVRRLRNDAALARAVRGIENALIFDGLELNVWTSAAGFSASLVPEQHTQPKPQAIVKRQGDLTTALIALAEQVTNADR